MERIRAVTGCGTQRELGRFLGINQSAISDAKTARDYPGGMAAHAPARQGINPDWVPTGKKGRALLAPAEPAEAAFSDCKSVTDISSPE